MTARPPPRPPASRPKRVAPRRPAPVEESPAEGEAPSDGAWARLDAKKKRLVMVGGAVVALLGVAVFIKGVTSSDEPGPQAEATPMGQTTPVDPADPQAAVAEALTRCRTYASPDLGTADWAKAEAACGKVLDDDPIHPEANQLLKRIKVEKECANAFSTGEKALARLREEEALEAFGRIGKDCSYYLKAKPKVKELIAGVMKRTADDCKRYLGDDHLESALPRCELHMKCLCQSMTPEQLYPPPGLKIDASETGRPGKGFWRPKEPMYLNLLRAREKVDPGAPPWKCPSMPICKAEAAPPGPRDEFAKALAARFDEKAFVEALLFYFDGKTGDAVNVLQQVKEKQEKAAFHARADDLRKQIISVDQLYKDGQANLQAGELEKAADPFHEALALDEKLVGAAFDKTQSFFRKNMHEDMASKAYEKGKVFAERQDTRQACRVWRLGFGFYRGNPALLKAVYFCTTKAEQALEEARGCADLARVADHAMDGDGIKAKLEDKRAEWKCPEAPAP